MAESNDANTERDIITTTTRATKTTRTATGRETEREGASAGDRRQQ